VLQVDKQFRLASSHCVVISRGPSPAVAIVRRREHAAAINRWSLYEGSYGMVCAIFIHSPLIISTVSFHVTFVKQMTVFFD